MKPNAVPVTTRVAPALVGLLVLAAHAGAQCDPSQRARLVGVGGEGMGFLGWSVALSGDGCTAAVGAPFDSSNRGAAYIYARTPTGWSQQGSKLAYAGAVGGQPLFGIAVSLSADGGTLLVGSMGSMGDAGGGCVFARSGTEWVQQWPRLSPAGSLGGAAYALSGDGNTVIVGAYRDFGDLGAAYVFVRSGGSWSQQGPALVPSGGMGMRQFFGSSVALSGDGNTAVIGAQGDSGGTGAAYVFLRSGEQWGQHGPKLVPLGGAGQVQRFGGSACISADGNTAMLGACMDNNQTGAAYVFVRGGASWLQQGSKLVGPSGVGTPRLFGGTVSLSGDGNVGVVGTIDDTNPGAAYLFSRSGGVWTRRSTTMRVAGGPGPAVFGRAVALSADGNTILAGAPGEGCDVGAAYVFVSADYDHNGQVDPADIAAFTSTWLNGLIQGTRAGDYDGDSVVTPADLSGYMMAWFTALRSDC